MKAAEQTPRAGTTHLGSELVTNNAENKTRASQLGLQGLHGHPPAPSALVPRVL